MVPLLQPPLINPHATLITLFMNAVNKNITDRDQIADMTPQSPTTKRLLKYLPPKRPAGANDPEIIKFLYARNIIATYDHVFNK